MSNYHLKIKDVRVRLGWTKQEMADYINVHRNTYASYEEEGGREIGLSEFDKVMDLRPQIVNPFLTAGPGRGV